MKRSYRERDYSFGERMLYLRSTIGLTQTGLAEHLHLTRFAVGEWEAGNKYPKAEHLRTLIELAVRHDAFSAGHEVDEIRALWKAARQKVLLDEQWINTLLGRRSSRHIDHAPGARSDGTRVDWGDALAIPNFYGRAEELTLLGIWIVEKRCRVISILGLGGIGKSALAVKAMRQVAEDFEVVIWRSLRNAPNCETLVYQLLQVLDPTLIQGAAISLEEPLNLLLEYLRHHRVLLVFDNLESLLEEKDTRGQMRSGYESYGELLRRIAETEHQSCLLFTSREKPRELVPLEGKESPVRSLRLTQLDATSCNQLLAEKEIQGTEAERSLLIRAYTGNPLALKIVAQTIADIFDGEIVPFLEEGEIIFGGVRELLDKQFSRLSPLEQQILVWLAILREATTLTELSTLLLNPVQRLHLLEAMDALHRRSLVERGQHPGTFTLQSVVLEYTTAHLISHLCSEFEQGSISYLIDYGIELTQVHEYVRQVQRRLLLSPILTRLHAVYRQQAGLEKLLLRLLDALRTQPEDEQGYAPANIIALLRELRGDLRAVDLSHLLIRAADLQETAMQECNLTNAMIRDSVFMQNFDSIQSLAIDGMGRYWAMTSYSKDVRLYEAGGQLLYRSWRVDSDWVYRVAISLDGRLLAGGTMTGQIYVWDVVSGELKWASERDTSLGVIYRLAISPDGQLLAIGSDTGTYLWDAGQGTLRAALPLLHQPSPVATVAWRGDGTILASGDVTGRIHVWSLQGVQLWDGQTGVAVDTFAMLDPLGYSRALEWSPDGAYLAIAMIDDSIHIFDMATHQSSSLGGISRGGGETLQWSPNGRLMAAYCESGLIRVWEVASGTLLGERKADSWNFAWGDDSTRLALIQSSSNGHTLFLWNVMSGEQIALATHPETIVEVAWMHREKILITASANGVVRWWDEKTGTCVRQMQVHENSIGTLKLSADESMLATTGDGGELWIWNARSGDLLKRLRADRPYERMNITGIKGLTEAQKLTLLKLGAIEDNSF